MHDAPGEAPIEVTGDAQAIRLPVDDEGLIDAPNLKCLNCRYLIHRLPIDGNCPECGHAIVGTLRNEYRIDPLPTWLDNVQGGIDMVAAGLWTATIAPPLGLFIMVSGGLAMCKRHDVLGDSLDARRFVCYLPFPLLLFTCCAFMSDPVAGAMAAGLNVAIAVTGVTAYGAGLARRWDVRGAGSGLVTAGVLMAASLITGMLLIPAYNGAAILTNRVGLASLVFVALVWLAASVYGAILLGRVGKRCGELRAKSPRTLYTTRSGRLLEVM